MSASSPPSTDVLNLPHAKVEEALLTGDMREVIEPLLGPQVYAEAVREARLAQNSTTRKRTQDRIYILPGIMGSTLGIPRTLFGNDTIWLDPLDVIRGDLSKLSLGEGGDPGVVPVGVMLHAYLLMRLRLLREGYDADFYPYDWRKDLTETGRDLAVTLKRDIAKGRRVGLVAHSMGGLVARVALAQLSEEEKQSISRFIMLGTPNHGSFSPVQVFFGLHDLAAKLAEWDKKHTPEELFSNTFATFTGLWQMVPFAAKNFVEFDLFDAAQWPTDRFGVTATRLAAARDFHGQIPLPDPRFSRLIAGVMVETLVGMKRKGTDQWLVTRSWAGDGTVPLSSAQVPDVPTYYAPGVEHGSLPNSAVVRDAVVDLLGKAGTTSRLPANWIKPEAPKDETSVYWPVAEPSLLELAMATPATTEGPPTPADVRALLAPFAGGMPSAPRASIATMSELLSASPMQIPSMRSEPMASSTAQALRSFGPHGLLVRRRIEQRLLVRLLPGRVMDAETEAYVFGVLENMVDVPPAGALHDLDALMGGVVTELFQRRVFSARNGEAFILPTRGRRLAAEMVMFAGVGNMSNLSQSVLRSVGEATARTLLAAKVRSFATQLLDAATTFGSAEHYKTNVHALLEGFIRTLLQLDRNRDMHEIMLCEPDPVLFQSLIDSISTLPDTGLLENLELVVNELPAPVSVASLTGRAGAFAALAGELPPAPIYLEVESDAANPDEPEMVWTFSLLSVGTAMLPKRKQTINCKELDKLLSRFKASARAEEIDDAGAELAKVILPPTILGILQKSALSAPWMVIHSTEPSRIPWEALRLPDRKATVLTAGIARRYLSQDDTAARWQESQRLNKQLRVLIISDPLGDLRSAEEEGKRVLQVLSANRQHFEIAGILSGKVATVKAVLEIFRTQSVDVLHYAGHAFFDRKLRARSGLLLSTGDEEKQKRREYEVLTGEMLAAESQLPTLVFFNACQSGRVRTVLGENTDPNQPAPPPAEDIENALGPAEAFLRSGVAAFLGTYWPVGDKAASEFAQTFYERIVEGATVGEALLEARRNLAEKVKSIDWANYIYYGSPDFRLKLK